MDSEIAPVQIEDDPFKEEPFEEQQATGQPTIMADAQTNAIEQSATNQSTTMANQPEDSQSTRQLNLFLNYSIRDQLIGCLMQLNTILEGNRPVPEVAKQRTHEKIEKLILSLVRLPFESPSLEPPPSEPPSAADSDVFEEAIADQLTLELPETDQSRLMGLLMENRNAVQIYDKVTDAAKRSLIAKNKRIIVQLVDVPYEELSDLICGAKSANEDAGEPSSKRQRGE